MWENKDVINKKIKFQINILDNEIINIYESNKKLLKNNIPSNKIVDYLFDQNFNIFEFIYFINDASIHKDINFAIVKEIFKNLKSLLKLHNRKINVEYANLNKESEYFDNFFLFDNSTLPFFSYSNFEYKPIWRNQVKSIYEIEEILDIFQMSNEWYKLQEILYYSKNNISLRDESKSKRILNWIIEDLEIEIYEFKIFDWYKKYPIEKKWLELIWNFYKSINKTKNINYKLVPLFYENKNIVSFDFFIKNIKNIFSENYLEFIDYINKNSNMYVFINNENEIEICKKKFFQLFIKLMEKENKNFFFEKENILSKHPYIQWNLLEISERYYENIKSEKIFFVNTKKQFFFNDFYKFYENEFPKILEHIYTLSPGWYCSNYFCEQFKEILEQYNINDFQLIHTILKFIFENKLNSEHKEVIDFTRQPGFIIEINDIDEWIMQVIENNNSNIKQVYELFKKEYGWNIDEVIAFQHRINQCFDKYKAINNNSNNLSQDQIDYLKNIIDEKEIISKEEFKNYFRQLNIPITYFNNYVLNKLLDCSINNTYITRRNNNLNKIIIKKIQNIPIFNLNELFDSIIEKGIITDSFIKQKFPYLSNKFILIKYSFNNYINMNMYNEEYNLISEALNDFLNTNQNNTNQIDKFIFYLDNYDLGKIKQYINYEFICSFLVHKKYYVFSINKIKWFSTEFKNYEELFLSCIDTKDNIGLYELIDLIENKINYIFDANEFSKFLKEKNNKFNNIYFDHIENLLWLNSKYLN